MMQLSIHKYNTCIKAYRRFQILHYVMRPLYNKQSFMELGVCQLENIVTNKDRQGFMFYEYSIFIRYYTDTKYLLNTIVERLITHLVK